MGGQQIDPSGVTAALAVAESIINLTPTKHDDIVVDVLWGAVRKAAGRPADK